MINHAIGVTLKIIKSMILRIRNRARPHRARPLPLFWLFFHHVLQEGVFYFSPIGICWIKKWHYLQTSPLVLYHRRSLTKPETQRLNKRHEQKKNDRNQEVVTNLTDKNVNYTLISLQVCSRLLKKSSNSSLIIH